MFAALCDQGSTFATMSASGIGLFGKNEINDGKLYLFTVAGQKVSPTKATGVLVVLA